MKKLLAAIAIIVLPFLCPKKAEAFQSLNINGVVYSFPDVDDEDWGQFVTDWAVAITTAIPSKKGGSFILSGELQFGATFGFQVPYIKLSTGPGALVASTGSIRLTAISSVSWRNQENTADLYLILGASNTLWFNGAQLSTASAASVSSMLANFAKFSAALSSSNVKTDETNVATTTLRTDLSQRTLVVDSNGTPGANVTRLTIAGAGGTYSQTLGTGTITLTGGTAPATQVVIVGTSAVRGAQIVGSTDQSFSFAMATVAANGGGNIFVQKGDYFHTHTTTLTNVNMIFEDSACVKVTGTSAWSTVFFSTTQSDLVNAQVDISTGIYKAPSTTAIFRIGNKARITKPIINLAITAVNTGTTADLFDLTGAIDSVIDNPTISSYTWMGNTQAMDSMMLFRINQATRCVIINPILRGNMGADAPQGAFVFAVGGTDDVSVQGGLMEYRGNKFFSTGALSGVFRGFRMDGLKLINYKSPDTNGLFYFEINSGVVFSSGNVFSNITVWNNVAMAGTTIGIGAGGAGPGGLTFNGWTVYNNLSASSGKFATVDNGNNIIFMNNFMRGTSDTTCFSDAGINTRWAGNDNFCNGTEQ